MRFHPGRCLFVAMALPAIGCTTASRFEPEAPMHLAAFDDDFTQDIEGTALSFDMVYVPPEDSEKAPSSGGFWVSRTEVTWEVFDVFVFRLDGSQENSEADVDAISRPSKPYIAMDRGFGHAGFPALSMSFHNATQFCQWLSMKTGRTYRLPTEEEWKSLCARSGITEDNAREYAWFRKNAKFKTQVVGSLKADALGLHDLWGNASEWCVTEDGTGVTMGGAYKDPIDGIGCAMRQEPVPAWNASDPQFPKSIWWLADAGFVGFRVICEKQQER